jgi:hypothetical protein
MIVIDVNVAHILYQFSSEEIRIYFEEMKDQKLTPDTIPSIYDKAFWELNNQLVSLHKYRRLRLQGRHIKYRLLSEDIIFLSTILNIP